MADNEIWSLAKNFRKRLEQAQNKEMLVGTMLEEFPIQCCGIASRLLAEFLRNIGVETLYISSEDYGAHEPHAWLVVKDERINLPRCCFADVPNNVMDLLSTYGSSSIGSISEASCYDAHDVENGLIIDITGDQFGEDPVYVGYKDRFHQRFEFISAHEHEGLCDKELLELYKIIISQSLV